MAFVMNFNLFQNVEKLVFVDKVIKRKDLNNQIGSLLSILLKKNITVNSEETNETSESIEQPTKAAS